MKYVVVLLILLSGCGYNVQPDTTTLEIGETSNGKEKTTQSIKQTFNWKK